MSSQHHFLDMKDIWGMKVKVLYFQYKKLTYCIELCYARLLSNVLNIGAFYCFFVFSFFPFQRCITTYV